MSQSHESSPRYAVWLWAGIGCLLLLAGAYHAKGVYHLTVGTEYGDAVDLRLRWCEQHYMLRGRNPFDVWAVHASRPRQQGVIPRETGRSSAIDPDLSVCDPAHPPWGYVSGALFFFPSWPLARWYFACLSLGASLAIGTWAWRQGRAHQRQTAWLWAAAVLAIGGSATALEVGQYGILLTACLVATLWCAESQRPMLGGLCLGIAMAKPTIAGPFMGALILQRHWQLVASALLYMLLASGVAWLMTATSPVELLQQLLLVGATIAEEGTLSPIKAFTSLGMGPTGATLLTMAVVVGVGMMLIYWSGSRHGLYGFAVAAVTARLWTYHKTYDNVMLIFTLLALGELAYRRPDTRFPMVAFYVMGASLWLPGRLSHLWLVQLIQLVVWLVAVYVVQRYYMTWPQPPQASTGSQRG